MSTPRDNLSTIAVHAGQTVGSDDRVPRRPDLPDDLLRVQEHRARRQSLCAEGIWQHLHPDHEPDDGCLRAARRRHRRRRRARWVSPRAKPPSSLALLNITQVGDEIVAGNNLYGGTYQLFHYTMPKLGRTVKFVDSRNPDAFAEGDHAQDARHLRRNDRQPQAGCARFRGPGEDRPVTRACR